MLKKLHVRISLVVDRTFKLTEIIDDCKRKIRWQNRTLWNSITHRFKRTLKIFNSNTIARKQAWDKSSERGIISIIKVLFGNIYAWLLKAYNKCKDWLSLRKEFYRVVELMKRSSLIWCVYVKRSEWYDVKSGMGTVGIGWQPLYNGRIECLSMERERERVRGLECARMGCIDISKWDFDTISIPSKDDKIQEHVSVYTTRLDIVKRRPSL